MSQIDPGILKNDIVDCDVALQNHIEQAYEHLGLDPARIDILDVMVADWQTKLENAGLLVETDGERQFEINIDPQAAAETFVDATTKLISDIQGLASEAMQNGQLNQIGQRFLEETARLVNNKMDVTVKLDSGIEANIQMQNGMEIKIDTPGLN